ncbi:unnamed protein product [Oncorhynchus mykiss]|uniref:tRNA(Phe) (4-demethylwyosine(37)-C(7)) aminocarboxypropyltransferase n=1 Tax=Oncorhynchus mykiss TaxID=8022 RepID=A0A060X5K8_ONCMY|nr:unnamed protein product [Oncorhynchus mykiss]
MFSAVNITEKLRVASFNCSGETVVDLYAGIGYLTIPVLVHAGASHVHACEWNPGAVEALQRNLGRQPASKEQHLYTGDQNSTSLCDLRIIVLGVFPAPIVSAGGWPVACRLLRKRTGGMLYIHQNVTAPHHITDCDTSSKFGVPGQRTQTSTLPLYCRTSLWTGVQHIEHVKSYAPHIHHVVLFLECRPL